MEKSSVMIFGALTAVSESDPVRLCTHLHENVTTGSSGDLAAIKSYNKYPRNEFKSTQVPILFLDDSTIVDGVLTQNQFNGLCRFHITPVIDTPVSKARDMISTVLSRYLADTFLQINQERPT